MAYEIDINESTSGTYTATLQDETGAAIASASVSSMRMTLIEVESGEIVNSRDNQSVLDANNCTLHATSGLLTWSIQAADTAITGSTPVGSREQHLATLTVAWGGGKQMHHEILLRVLNLRSVPQGA